MTAITSQGVCRALSGLKSGTGKFSIVVNDLLTGIWDPVSITFTTYLLIFMLFFSTWASQGQFRSDYDLLSKMAWMAVVGFIVHFMVQSAVARPLPKFDMGFFSLKEDKGIISLIAFGFLGVVIAQFITTLIIPSESSLSGLSVLTVPNIFINASAGIVEEWAFAWGIFSFLIFLTRNRKNFLIPCLFADSLIFALFHSAVGFAFYQGNPAYLPTIFASRVVLDLSFYFSKGRLSVPMGIHILINVSRSTLSALPVGIVFGVF